jgi:murein DD-endopeptidase MepM/ murein hydrolase activator NlpD
MRLRNLPYALSLIAACCALWVASCSRLASSGSGAAHSVSVTRAVLLSRDTVPQQTLPATRRAGPSRPAPEATSPVPATQPALTLSPLPRPGKTAAVSLPSYFLVCSPLEGVELEKLSLLISDPYRPPPKGSDERHPGVDFAYYHWKDRVKIDGSLLQAVLGGRVAASLADTFPYGNVVIIETPAELLPDGLVTALDIPTGQSLYLLYAHMKEDSLTVKLGEPVEPCHIIGAVGSTGNSGAPHLHLEVRMGPPGKAFDRMSYYTETASIEEKKNYRLWSVSGEFVHLDPMRLIQYGIDLLHVPTLATETGRE